MGEVSHINGLMTSDQCWVGEQHIGEVVAGKTSSSATILF